MKLISMTDFVLENAKQPYVEGTKYKDLVNYAKFLKQPLNLGMFFPCDENGNIIEPLKFTICGTPIWDGGSKYQKAKSKVFFEGFCINGEDDNIITLEHENICIEFHKEHEVFICDNHVLINIEDLSNFELQLTESAIKQIGL